MIRNLHRKFVIRCFSHTMTPQTSAPPAGPGTGAPSLPEPILLRDIIRSEKEEPRGGVKLGAENHHQKLFFKIKFKKINTESCFSKSVPSHLRTKCFFRSTQQQNHRIKISSSMLLNRQLSKLLKEKKTCGQGIIDRAYINHFLQGWET